MDVKNINQVFVGANCNRTANVQIHDPSNTTTYIGLGEVVIVDETGTVLDNQADPRTSALKTKKEIYVVGRSVDGKSIYRSAPLLGKGIQNMFCKQYTAATEQVTTLGYNGTTGLFTAVLAASTYYAIRIVSTYQDAIVREVTKSFAYTAGLTTPTQADIVTGIVKNFALSNNVNIDLSIKMEALCNNAGAAITGTGNLIVTKGSKTVKATNVDAVLAVGDYLRINSTATTGAMYKVAAMDIVNNFITLDAPYQGTSGVILEASNEYVSAANGAAANWGIKITSLPLYFEVGKWDYRKEYFDVTTNANITSTPVTSVKAFKGVGTYEEVAELEWFNKPFFGNNVKTHPMYPVSYPLDVNASLTYDIITINWINEETRNIEGSTLQSGTVTICLPVGAGQADGGTTTVEEVLNKYVVTENGIGTVIAVS